MIKSCFIYCGVNSHFAYWHTAKHTIGAQYMLECVIEHASHIFWCHHYWVSELKGVRNVACFLSSVP